VPMPQPPAALPHKGTRARVGGPDRQSITLSLRTVTPILGGGYATRSLDEVSFVRASAIRGHLRFWWRALFAGQDGGQNLYAREGELWGHAGDDAGGRSEVELVVTPDERTFNIDSSQIDLKQTAAYALWPARGQQGGLAAPRWMPGAQFELRLVCPSSKMAEVRQTLTAWILFGGIGGRTRRGVGSIGLAPSASFDLPTALSQSAIDACLGAAFFLPDGKTSDVARLAGATIVGGTPTTAKSAWETALGWLRAFRQDPAPAPGYDQKFARCGGVPANRPGRSNWPEADKVRHLLNTYPIAHQPRHNAAPVWPRAGFGLPIVARFQQMRREGGFHTPPEPNGFELRWARGPEVFDRLASPLIVKPVALAGGLFAPCALWLNRAFPVNGQVGLFARGAMEQASLAPFDRLVAAGDAPLYAPLNQPHPPNDGQGRLQAAFNDWLVHSRHATRVF